MLNSSTEHGSISNTISLNYALNSIIIITIIGTWAWAHTRKKIIKLDLWFAQMGTQAFLFSVNVEFSESVGYTLAALFSIIVVIGELNGI